MALNRLQEQPAVWKIANEKIFIFDLVQYLILIRVFIPYSGSSWGQGTTRKFLNQGQLKHNQYVIFKVLKPAKD